MKVYLVLAWYDYYPSSDNCKGVFQKEEDAEDYLTGFKMTSTYDRYEIVEKELT